MFNFISASNNLKLRETITTEIRYIESRVKLLNDELVGLDLDLERNYNPDSSNDKM